MKKRRRRERVSFVDSDECPDSSSDTNQSTSSPVIGDINGRLPGQLGISHLMIAAREGDIESVQMLIELGADLTAVDSRGFDALMYSVRNGNAAVTRILLTHLQSLDANFASNFRNSHGLSHILYAATLGRVDCIATLFEFGCRLDIPDSSGFTPLMGAAQHNHIHAIALLLDIGAAVDSRDNSGLTPLIWATRFNCLEAAALLICKGKADVNLTDYTNRSPLYYAVVCGYTEIGKLLLNHGAVVSDMVRYAILMEVSTNKVKSDIEDFPQPKPNIVA